MLNTEYDNGDHPEAEAEAVDVPTLLERQRELNKQQGALTFEIELEKIRLAKEAKPIMQAIFNYEAVYGKSWRDG